MLNNPEICLHYFSICRHETFDGLISLISVKNEPNILSFRKVCTIALGWRAEGREGQGGKVGKVGKAKGGAGRGRVKGYR